LSLWAAETVLNEKSEIVTVHITYNEEKRQHHLALHYSLRMDPGFAKVGGLRRARIVSLIYSWGMGAEPPAVPVGRWEPPDPQPVASPKG